MEEVTTIRWLQRVDAALKIVTRLPVQELWREDGFTTTSRGRPLTDDNITSLLRIGTVQFVVAAIGFSLSWVPLNDCYQFWKGEAKPHLAEPQSKAILDGFPGGYCYFASEWGNQDRAIPIVVLEKHH